MKNEEFDNLSDKRFKDIVDAYKRNHPMPAEKKNTPMRLETSRKIGLRKSKEPNRSVSMTWI